MDSFNLVDEEWIPVLWRDGRFARIGILEALERAGEIRQIAAGNPMDRVALLRFLLAVLYWCRGNPPEGEEKERILAEGRFAEDFFALLRKKKASFNLFGDAPRFYQDRLATRTRASTDLLQEIPTGNNFWHFRHSVDEQEGLCPACCALGLLRLPLFSVSGLPDLKAGINGAPPIYIIPLGPTLLHALCINWIAHATLGQPTWDQSILAPKKGTPFPLLTGLSALARRVWLHSPEVRAGCCVGCGVEASALVRTCEFQTAGEQRNDDWTDPHVVYTEKKDKDGVVGRRALNAPDLTKSFFQMDRPWTPLLEALGGWPGLRGKPASVELLIAGFATDKAKNVDLWERTWIIPSDLSTEQNRTATAQAIARWSEEGRKLAFRMKPLGSTSHGIEFRVATTAIRPHVESNVSEHPTELLSHPQESWPAAIDQYRGMIHSAAGSLAPGYTTRAVQRRNQIAQCVPNMTAPPAAKTPKPRSKKRGGA